MPWRALFLVACLLLPIAGAEAAPPTVTYDGRSYLELTRAAQAARAKVEASGRATRAYVRTAGHVVTLTRNWAQVLVDGRPLVLDAPVRVSRGVWLVPPSFVERVLKKLPPAAAAAPRPALALAAAAARAEEAVAPVTSLVELRSQSYPSFTRVVLETAGPVTYRIESGAGREARVRVAGLDGAPRAHEIRDGLVDEVRLERAGADLLLRVAFETAAETRASTLADPYRLVFDFRRRADGTAPDGGPLAAPLRVIVLDAGHGGHDSGALGPTGLLEKDVVLDVTKRVGRLVQGELGVKVLLSRDGDHFVTLRDRTSFANRERADLFVSIHANAHRDVANQGVETYFLSSEATDSAARQVAAQENSVVQLERPAAGRGRHDPVKAILWELAQSDFQIESSRLAEIVQDSMTQSLRIPNRGVKQAGFYVLGGAAMPAILIEIGFVTNPREERKLRDTRYRDDIARAIVSGLAEYKRHWDQRMRAEAPRAR